MSKWPKSEKDALKELDFLYKGKGIKFQIATELTDKKKIKVSSWVVGFEKSGKILIQNTLGKVLEHARKGNFWLQSEKDFQSIAKAKQLANRVEAFPDEDEKEEMLEIIEKVIQEFPEPEKQQDKDVVSIVFAKNKHVLVGLTTGSVYLDGYETVLIKGEGIFDDILDLIDNKKAEVALPFINKDFICFDISIVSHIASIVNVLKNRRLCEISDSDFEVLNKGMSLKEYRALKKSFFPKTGAFSNMLI